MKPGGKTLKNMTPKKHWKAGSLEGNLRKHH